MTLPLHCCLLGLVLLACGCRCQPERPAEVQTPDVAVVAPVAVDIFAQATVTGIEPPAELPFRAVVAALRVEVRQPKMGRVADYLTEKARRELLPEPDKPLLAPLPTVADKIEPTIQAVDFNGGRAALSVKRSGLMLTAWFYLRQGRWQWDLADGRPLEPAWPGPPDPHNQPITLAVALDGVVGTGPPQLIFATSAGAITCTLFADKMPELVANVIGLATGRRASRLAEGRTLTQTWQHRPFYDGTTIHRAAPNGFIEGGDPFAIGTGHAGYRIADQFDLALRHDKPGVLSLATIGPNSASSIWRIDLLPAPDRDDRDPVIGQCANLDVVRTISQLPANSVRVTAVTVQR